jgi:tetratricopeptide (TPR) repeat protein
MLRQQQEPPDDLARGDAMSDLGAALLYLGEYSESEAILAELLALRIRAAGAVSKQTGETLNDLGMIYIAKGDYRRAVDHFLRALEVRRTVEAGDGPDVANTMADLSIVYRDTGRLDEARDLLERADDLPPEPRSEDRARVFDAAHRAQSPCLIYQISGPFGPRLGLLNEAIALTRKLFGNDHFNVFGVYDQPWLDISGHSVVPAEAEIGYSRGPGRF